MAIKLSGLLKLNEAIRRSRALNLPSKIPLPAGKPQIFRGASKIKSEFDLAMKRPPNPKASAESFTRGFSTVEERGAYFKNRKDFFKGQGKNLIPPEKVKGYLDQGFTQEQALDYAASDLATEAMKRRAGAASRVKKDLKAAEEKFNKALDDPDLQELFEGDDIPKFTPKPKNASGGGTKPPKDKDPSTGGQKPPSGKKGPVSDASLDDPDLEEVWDEVGEKGKVDKVKGYWDKAVSWAKEGGVKSWFNPTTFKGSLGWMALPMGMNLISDYSGGLREKFGAGTKWWDDQSAVDEFLNTAGAQAMYQRHDREAQARLDSLRQQNRMALMSASPTLANSLMAGMALPEDGILIGARSREDLLDEVADGMSQGAFGG